MIVVQWSILYSTCLNFEIKLPCHGEYPVLEMSTIIVSTLQISVITKHGVIKAILNNAHKYNLRCPIVCKATQHCVGRWRYERWARLLCVLLQLCSQKQQQCLMFLEIKTRFQTASQWHHKAVWIALVVYRHRSQLLLLLCTLSLKLLYVVWSLDILVIPSNHQCSYV